MPSKRVSRELNSGTYFLIFVVNKWHYIFDRYRRWNILAEVLSRRIEKGIVVVEGFVFMINHLHLIVTSEDIAGFVHGFKRYISGEIKKSMLKNEPRLISTFLNKESKFQFWERTNMPIWIETEWFFSIKN